MRKSFFSFFILLSIATSAGGPQPRQKSKNLSGPPLAARVADVIADRRIFRVTPATVTKKLRSLVELKGAEPTTYLWRFTGANSESGVHWAQVDFQPSEPGGKEKWQLLQIWLGLAPADRDYGKFYEALSLEITKRLGKASQDAPGTSDKRRAWRVAPYWEVAIRVGEFENPVDKRTEQVVLTEVAVLQGEADRTGFLRRVSVVEAASVSAAGQEPAGPIGEGEARGR